MVSALLLSQQRTMTVGVTATNKKTREDRDGNKATTTTKLTTED